MKVDGCCNLALVLNILEEVRNYFSLRNNFSIFIFARDVMLELFVQVFVFVFFQVSPAPIFTLIADTFKGLIFVQEVIWMPLFLWMTNSTAILPLFSVDHGRTRTWVDLFSIPVSLTIFLPAKSDFIPVDHSAEPLSLIVLEGSFDDGTILTHQVPKTMEFEVFVDLTSNDNGGSFNTTIKNLGEKPTLEWKTIQHLVLMIFWIFIFSFT